MSISHHHNHNDHHDDTYGEQGGRECGELQEGFQQELHSLPRSQNCLQDDHDHHI